LAVAVWIARRDPLSRLRQQDLLALLATRWGQIPSLQAQASSAARPV
jgi:hypothetical protein